VKFNTPVDLRSCHYPLGFLLLFSAIPLFAADDDELFFEIPVVLSANRLEQPVSDAAVSISVIDRETIERSGARNIPEVLRLVPGMQVGYSGNEFGDDPRYVVTYHGHSDQYSKQIQVLIDGRSIYEPFFGGINWKAIPININDIERIEVSRGPNMATYGANAFQAAINIITRTAAEDQGSYVQSNVGSNGVADLTYRFGGQNGGLDYRITASSYNDDGADSANQFDYNDDTHSNNIDYRLDYQLNDRNTLSYQGGYGANRQQADRNHEAPLPTQRTIENQRFFQFIKWENIIDSDNTLQLQYYYNLNDKEDRYLSDTIDPGSGLDPFVLDIDADIKSERHNLELTHFIYPNENLKLIWGLVAQVDFVQSALFLGTESRTTHKQYRAFATAEWSITDSNVLNVGGLVEKHDLSDTAFSPRISLTHAFNHQNKVRVGVSQALRGPFIFENAGNQNYTQELTAGGTPIGVTLFEQVLFGSKDLKNEKIISREIAYFGEFLNSALLFNGRLFYDSISNYIDTLRVPSPSPPDNVNDNLNDPGSPNTMLVFSNPIASTTRGLELELDYHIDASLRLIASGAMIKIHSDSDAASRSAPQHSYSLLLTKQFNEKYNTSVAYYYVESFKWMDARGTNDYRILDLRFSRNFKAGGNEGSVSLVLKNLLDDYSNYNAATRNSTAPVVIQNTVAYVDFRLSF
jgi:iron complex outermembrane receptor protein